MSESLVEETEASGNDEPRQSRETDEGEQAAATTSGVHAADSECEAGQNESEEKDEDDTEPPAKKSKKGSSKKNGDSSAGSQEKYPYARLRGIRIFSDREIDAQDADMTKEYWRFWNETAEELCSDRAYNDWGKRDLKLYIDAAWIIHKTYLQELRERELSEAMKELGEKHGYVELPQKLKTQEQAVKGALAKLQDSTANLNELNLELSRNRGKSMNLKQRPVDDTFSAEQKEEETRVMKKQVSEQEKNLYEGMSEVKRDQDSLKKALNRQKALVFKARQERPLSSSGS